MKLNQRDVFGIITDIRSKGCGIPESPYPSINDVCDVISKKCHILIDQSLKDIARYQLKRYKNLK